MASAAVIKFLNDDLRPLAEKLRALKAHSQSAMVRWENTLKLDIPDEGDKTSIDDGRAKEGVSQVKIDEVYLLMKLLFSTTNEIDDALIERFCVRSLEVQ